jgi:hypothetical protein
MAATRITAVGTGGRCHNDFAGAQKVCRTRVLQPKEVWMYWNWLSVLLCCMGVFGLGFVSGATIVQRAERQS